MKNIISAALGLSLMIGSAALSFGAQDPAMPAKTDSTVTKETTKTKVKGQHPKKVKSETRAPQPAPPLLPLSKKAVREP